MVGVGVGEVGGHEIAVAEVVEYVLCGDELSDGQWGWRAKYFTSSLTSSKCTMDTLEQPTLVLCHFFLFRSDKS